MNIRFTIFSAFVITDGKSDNARKTSREAALLHKSGVLVFAIGVKDDIDQEELRQIASHPDASYMFTVETYDALRTLAAVLEVKKCAGIYFSMIMNFDIQKCNYVKIKLLEKCLCSFLDDNNNNACSNHNTNHDALNHFTSNHHTNHTKTNHNQTNHIDNQNHHSNHQAYYSVHQSHHSDHQANHSVHQDINTVHHTYHPNH